MEAARPEAAEAAALGLQSLPDALVAAELLARLLAAKDLAAGEQTPRLSCSARLSFRLANSYVCRLPLNRAHLPPPSPRSRLRQPPAERPRL